MKKNFILLALIIFIISGCSDASIEEVSKGLDISNYQTSIGAADDSHTFDKQKFSYDITISNQEKIEIKRDSVEIVLTDWIKEKQLENKITDLTFNSESIIMKGYVIFDTKGLNKKEIVGHQPFIDGISVETNDGEKFSCSLSLIK